MLPVLFNHEFCSRIALAPRFLYNSAWPNIKADVGWSLEKCGKWWQ